MRSERFYSDLGDSFHFSTLLLVRNSSTLYIRLSSLASATCWFWSLKGLLGAKLSSPSLSSSSLVLIGRKLSLTVIGVRAAGVTPNSLAEERQFQYGLGPELDDENEVLGQLVGDLDLDRQSPFCSE